jgi:RHH-type proline utilization regulon transcriptional repressor/proline dehydrogenase/delta 1-pyrroline-5-carboxylate dehydrogenase
LAETLLRVPDAATADALIKDKLSGANWQQHLKNSDSLLVNASTWGLMLTGKVFRLDQQEEVSGNRLMDRMLNKLGEPVVRNAMYGAMKIMGKQFVLGRTIQEALSASEKQREKGYTHSYDMLGEAALTQADAKRYLQSYRNAIQHIGDQPFSASFPARPTISIKLSALHPRYEVSQQDRVLSELLETLIELVQLARNANVGINIDAEEMDRLELSLDLFEALYRHPVNQGWGDLGIVVQAYSKRALPVLMWLTQLAKSQGDRIPVRLVKGAYWDAEIKLCQQMGTQSYPVFTRKAATDVSYLACAQYLFSQHTLGCLFPMFATHNAHTLVCVQQMAAASGREFELQRLHGMGEELYNVVLKQNPNQSVRIYAPVGSHKDLLPYLVRRLLENGANSSFVHKLTDPNTPVESFVNHPITALNNLPDLASHRIPLPPNIYMNRQNSRGINLHIASHRQPFLNSIQSFVVHQWQAGPLVNGEKIETNAPMPVICPQNHSQQIGQIDWADADTADRAVNSAKQAYPKWNETPIETRANCLEKLADRLESHSHELIALCSLEAGKTLQDGIDEVREAVDFCRYYAVQAKQLFADKGDLQGPTGESNQLLPIGRGVFVCISPWNFPLAIFIGQISAALVTGNTVIAKPAPQTGLVAYRAIQLAFEAGIPPQVLHFLPGDGSIGAQLTQSAEINSVCFTGSTLTARKINISLAQRSGPIATLVAETGGQNAMIVDSTALPEQVVTDVIASAFGSAGQRCSALRVLYVQQDVADRVIELIQGAMKELKIGDPIHYRTDIGPVIDKDAKQKLEQHIATISQTGKLIAKAPMPEPTEQGSFVQPSAIEIQHISELTEEHFGPILHVIRYAADAFPQVIEQINGTGFGLTLGIHTRNESLALSVANQVNVGNVYINRNQVGAVVGVQPFGGQGLSGTGPKAGGPHYLQRFISEKTVTNNVTALGGNTTLLSLADE